MEVVRTIKPGQPGTRRFQKHWGDNLVAVRYRCRAATLYTTIEIIVDERDQPKPPVSLNAVHSYQRQQIVAVKILYEESALRTAAKNNRARWSADHKVWLMPYVTAVALGVSGRVIEGLAERCDDVEMYDG